MAISTADKKAIIKEYTCRSKKNLRQFAIAVLDDPDGINEEAYEKLAGLLLDNDGNEDILNMVLSTEGRFYLPEEHGLI